MGKYLIYSVEDDEGIRELLECAMQTSGYDIVTFDSAETMLKTLKTNRCDLILMDIMLPEMDGIEALKEVKKYYPDIAVIMLSAKDTELNKVKGLDAGADDYITKPFGILELIARIKARLRKPAFIEFDGIKIDETRHEVSVNFEEIKLTNKEYDLLKKLLENAEQVIKRDDLLNEIWGIDFDGETRTLDMHVMSLRTKLGDKGALIKTIRGVGYIATKNANV